MQKDKYTIGLVGNPNVGKSTVFNQLTGLHQHTGNWTGKTVANAVGTYVYGGKTYTLIDTPGTYSLYARSQEEEITRDFIKSGQADVSVMVADATCLERNLILLLQVLEITKNVVLCINLIDEAHKKGIMIDKEKLRLMLGIPIVLTGARGGKGLDVLKGTIEIATRFAQLAPQISDKPAQSVDLISESEHIFNACVTVPENAALTDRKIDRILTHPFWGTLSMLA
ncbi:MAG: 50S ribosome-binding GTPase, partial [Clostridia bacterium]|nr:50S ribosome-binding GTPase [Clostridia bacterium]